MYLYTNAIFSSSVDAVIPLFDNKSFEYDGVSDSITLGDSNDFTFSNGTNDSPFSISAWVNMSTIGSFIIVSKDSVSNREYAFRVVSNNIRVFLLDNSSGGYIGRYYNSSLASYQGTWTHFCFTYNGNGASSGVKIYLNGSRVDNANYEGGSYSSMENTSSDLNIGRQEISGLFSDGNIDEPSIFDYELTSTQVSTIYGVGVPTDISSLSPLGHWRAENSTWNGSVWSVTDSGSGGNNGTSSGMTLASRTTDVPT